MANNKVALADGTVLIDLTSDSVNENNLLSGATAHGADGNIVRGALIMPETIVEDAEINGESIVANGVAVIPIATRGSNNTAGVLGVVMVNDYSGININSNGRLTVISATNANIDARSGVGAVKNAGVITPANIDYAVKAAMCDSRSIEWSAEEISSVQEKIGVPNDAHISSLIDVAIENRILGAGQIQSGNATIEFNTGSANTYVDVVFESPFDGTPGIILSQPFQGKNIVYSNVTNTGFRAALANGFTSSGTRTFSWVAFYRLNSTNGIPPVVTDAHINELIDAKLEEIENGTY